MAKTMAEVLHVHTRRTGIRGMAIHCECGWSESILGMRSSKKAFAAHQSAALSAAGYGLVADFRESNLKAVAEEIANPLRQRDAES